MKKGSWGTKLGFYFAAVGSAFGLGSLWRFPYIVKENGGAAFILLYAVLVFVIGLPLLIGELMIGKSTGKSLLSAATLLGEGSSSVSNSGPLRPWLKKVLPIAARGAIIICLIILAYYSVICGWVLFFVMQFIKTIFTTVGAESNGAVTFLMESGWLQVLLTSAHLLMVVVIVGKGVEQGMERWVATAMPLFSLLLVVIVAKTLTLETHSDALRFLFYPDFSKLNISSLANAVGHVFFALSIGFGTMVTFGSYLNKETYLPLAGFRIASLDIVISVFAALLVFPLVFSITKEAEGPELLFKTVPIFFHQLPGGEYLGFGFFLCLYLAALSASIGLFETVVANLMERYRLKRTSAAWRAGLTCFVLSIIPALSSSVLRAVNYEGRGLLELLDLTLVNWLLPLVVLVFGFVVVTRLSDSLKEREFMKETGPTARKLCAHWIFALKWVVPAVILTALALEIIGIFRS